MDITKDAFEYLVEAGKKLQAVEEHVINSRTYTRQELKRVEEPTVTPLQISTLSSLVDLCTDKFGASYFEGFEPAKHVIHVVNEKSVQVVSAASNIWKEREVLIECRLTETTPFPLGKFLKQDEFIIALLSCCVGIGDRDLVARLAGNATAEHVSTAQDDGVSQQIGVRSGAHLQTQETIKNIVDITLFRTFREVEQPVSPFLFRVQQSGENLPTFAFFEADGGAWKLKAIENVARFLRAGIPEAVVAS